MMALLVLAYPKITDEDLAWIQSIRQKHDWQYKIIEPHFTIVFPVFKVEKDSFIVHVQQQVADFQTFDFILRCAVVEKDAFNDLTHVFLVPDEGFSHFVKLHDRLYTGVLAPELRLDISFIPHIGIGSYRDPIASKKLADELNGRNFTISGKVDALDIVVYENNVVETLEQILLKTK